MKKQKVIFSKKLVLVKEQITPLNDQQTGAIVAGATTDACNTRAAGCTRPSVLCPPLSHIIICVTHAVTLACKICH